MVIGYKLKSNKRKGTMLESKSLWIERRQASVDSVDWSTENRRRYTELAKYTIQF
jgi:hypothetical protein